MCVLQVFLTHAICLERQEFCPIATTEHVNNPTVTPIPRSDHTNYLGKPIEANQAATTE